MPKKNIFYYIKEKTKDIITIIVYPIIKKIYFRKYLPAVVQHNQYFYQKETGTYCPWLNDTAFLETYQSIKEGKKTMVDINKIYELWTLTKQMVSQPNLGAFLEIGVWRGGTAAIIAKQLSLSNASVPFYLADTFMGVPKAGADDPNYKGGEHADTTQQEVEDLVLPLYKNISILTGIFPDQTAHNLPIDIRFSYCHIDVDVYKSAQDIVDYVWPKLNIGGVIVFDDYGCIYTQGVTTYVNSIKDKSDRIFIYNSNQHGILIKIA